MYIKREKRRGFNQSEIIAKELAKKSKARLLSLLEKVFDTKSQTELTKERRSQNLKDSFAVNKNIKEIEQVLLVDDFFTTGATMRECCKVLKKAGIEKVWGFTLARIP